MLVLLAIIITTSTLVEKHIIPLDVPKSSTQTKISKDVVVLSIKKDGMLFMDEKQIDATQLSVSLARLEKDTPISLNCHKESAFKYFVSVLEVLKAQHFTNLSIITKDE